MSLHVRLAELIVRHKPEVVAVEDLFHAKNARSALKLGHVRGIVLLAASQAGVPVAEYTPTQVKRAVVGYGRAGKHQVQEMVTLLLGLEERPSPLDVSDALAVAICHAHLQGAIQNEIVKNDSSSQKIRSWRQYRVEGQGES
jgi:crossover junction endodeoxyribonuclease RuvC